MAIYIIITLAFLAGLGFSMRYLLRRLRRDKLLKMPMSEEWLGFIHKNLPVYKKMPRDLQRQLQGMTQVFVDEKEFIGAEGLEITDEMKVTIAAQACMLLLNRKEDIYPYLYNVIVYPDAYQHTHMVPDENGVMKEETITRLGESWTKGSVVLSWKHSKQGGSNFSDGHNVVIHEFSHQLDQADGVADGTPILEENSAYRGWGSVLGAEYKKLQTRSKKEKRRAVLREYGATNEAEFFAVSSEAFFEKPKQMRKKHPELFEELKEYYKVDPSEWQ